MRLIALLLVLFILPSPTKSQLDYFFIFFGSQSPDYKDDLMEDSTESLSKDFPMTPVPMPSDGGTQSPSEIAKCKKYVEQLVRTFCDVRSERTLESVKVKCCREPCRMAQMFDVCFRDHLI